MTVEQLIAYALYCQDLAVDPDTADDWRACGAPFMDRARALLRLRSDLQTLAR